MFPTETSLVCGLQWHADSCSLCISFADTICLQSANADVAQRCVRQRVGGLIILRHSVVGFL